MNDNDHTYRYDDDPPLHNTDRRYPPDLDPRHAYNTNHEFFEGDRRRNRREASPPAQERLVNNIFRLFFGSMLMVFGIAVAAWILHTIYGLILAQDNIALLQRFNFKAQTEDLIANVTSETISLPEEIFFVVGFILIIVLLVIALKIARVLIQCGTSLLHSDIKLIAKRLRDELIDIRDSY